ncbi:MAG: hypothetical protein AABW88_04845 [Nanoarchaeota archaeon]
MTIIKQLLGNQIWNTIFLLIALAGLVTEYDNLLVGRIIFLIGMGLVISNSTYRLLHTKGLRHNDKKWFILTMIGAGTILLSAYLKNISFTIISILFFLVCIISLLKIVYVAYKEHKKGGKK